jgi:hypothetical protein
MSPIVDQESTFDDTEKGGNEGEKSQIVKAGTTQMVLDLGSDCGYGKNPPSCVGLRRSNSGRIFPGAGFHLHAEVRCRWELENRQNPIAVPRKRRYTNELGECLQQSPTANGGNEGQTTNPRPVAAPNSIE